MTISCELIEKILRHFYVEKWRVGTISRHFNVHHETVKRILAENGVSNSKLVVRPSLIDGFLPFMLETLKKYPHLTGSRLYQMMVERGYAGGPDHFRHILARHRPRPHAEAYLRVKTLPGEQAQVDWGHFGHVTLGGAKRPVMAFVMVLSFSRKIFLRFYLNCQMTNFLRGHVAAFDEFQGVPRVLLYDNLKSAVLERMGDAIRFNPTLLQFAAYYRFEPKPVAVARGNEKGRVERAIRYIRTSFFPAREWQDLDDLNEQAKKWCQGPASARPCPENLAFSVQETFETEKDKLIALPDNPFETHERVEVKVGKTPYARFDLNDYSVPHMHVQRMVTVIAELDTVRILDGQTIIAQHPRSYDKLKQIEDPTHVQALVAEKVKARLHRGQNFLTNALPNAFEFLSRAAERGYAMGGITSTLLKLLDQYGREELTIALADAINREVPHTNAVRLCLEKRREERNQPPPVALDLPADKRVRELTVQTHKLNTYDEINTDKTKENAHD